MTQAEDFAETYFRQLKAVGRTRFAPPKTVKVERVGKVKFCTFPDGSRIRFEDGDAQTY